jgi:NCS1 family nucleobase:cation symporter-1
MYKLGFLLSFTMGGVLFYLFNLIWPVPVYPVGREEEEKGGMAFESMARTEGFFEGESVEGIRMGLVPGVGESEKRVGFGVREV